MSATGRFAEGLADIVTKLEALGLTVITDPRNVRPISVFVELPSFTTFSKAVSDTTVVVRLIAAPPGNQDAADWLMTQTDLIVNAGTLGVTDGQPSQVLIGDQSLPAFDITIRLTES